MIDEWKAMGTQTSAAVKSRVVKGSHRWILFTSAVAGNGIMIEKY